jgi:hypothetical protein
VRTIVVAGLAAVLLLAGCGGRASHPPAAAPAAKTARVGLRVAVVGNLHVGARGAVVVHRTLRRAASAALVLASATSVGPARLAGAADAHPETHFALVGASTAGFRRPNLAGVVLRRDQGALLAGAVAGLVADEQGSVSPRVAWVGPARPALAAAFERGVGDTSQAVVVRTDTRAVPVACKEAAIAAIEAGAVVVAADGGACAEAVAAAAHDQGLPALAVSDFLLPDVAAGRVVREAVSGGYYGGEDVIFGARSGVVGIRRLDPAVPASVAVRAHIAAQQLENGGVPSG